MNLSFDLLRPDDLLAITIELRNMRLRALGGKTTLVVDQQKEPAYLIVHFPPQTITERAFFETSPTATPTYNQPPPPPDPSVDPLLPPGEIDARMGGASRLVFRVKDNTKAVPFTIEALLDWSGLELVVSPAAAVALGKGAGPEVTIAAPTDLQTAIELPYRLLLSPNAKVGWLHSTAPVTHAGRTELWHTRMGRILKQGKLGETSAISTLPLRAIWSPDFRDHQPLPNFTDNGPFLAPMTPRDRAEIVILTSGFNGYFTVVKDPVTGGETRKPYLPAPVQASRLFLSALGGWLSSRGHWDPLPSYDLATIRRPPSPRPPVQLPPGEVKPKNEQLANANRGKGEPEIYFPPPVSLELSEWDHIATEGRDHYVKIVYEGFLYPVGHRASLVKVTERKFVGSDAGVVNAPVAYLRQHLYIVLREEEKTYSDPSTVNTYASRGRENPFRNSVVIKTKVTPDIDQPALTLAHGTTDTASDSFWVQVGGADYPFHLVVQDLSGAKTDMHMPLIFVPVSEERPEVVQQSYASEGGGERRAGIVHSKNVTYANPADGDTTLKTLALYFDAQVTQFSPPYVDAPFLPKLDGRTAANVSVPAIEGLNGGSPVTRIHFYAPYLQHDIDPNAGVFACTNTPFAVGFTADKGGGFATPKLSVTALSSRKGLVAGSADDAAAGEIKPTDFFSDLTAKLFGTIPLQSLIKVGPDGKAPAANNSPEIRTHYTPNHKNPVEISVRLSWSPEVQDYPPAVTSSSGGGSSALQVKFNINGASSALTLNATFNRFLNGSPPTSTVKGVLTNFLITLFNVVGLQFNSLSFTSKNGAKNFVSADLPASNPIQFLGALAFVQKLADVLPPGLFGGKGPSIKLTKQAIKVSYTLGLPSVSVGVLSLEHIAITTGLDLPYLDGKPAFEFAFASRSKPFLITVECLGGGGFVHLVITADGVQMVEGALEFGGEFSIDLGIASGGVHIMAGIYFQLTDTSTTLTGFVDIGGEVSVLGIISVSIDLNLSLSFVHNQQGNKVRGRATLTISVHIFFFSISVSVSVERSFGSAGGDPRMKQLIGPTDWAAYAAAFA